MSKYSLRVFAQAIAVGHMIGHAIVSSDYFIKVVDLLYPDNKEKTTEERKEQIGLRKSIIEEYMKMTLSSK